MWQLGSERIVGNSEAVAEVALGPGKRGNRPSTYQYPWLGMLQGKPPHSGETLPQKKGPGSRSQHYHNFPRSYGERGMAQLVQVGSGWN